MEVKPWVFKGSHFTVLPNAEEYYAFVYEIRNVETGKKYIGKKLLWFKSKKKVLLKNGKKKAKKILVESDWRDYFGSSQEFLKEVESTGKDKYVREILHLCKTKAEASYLEAHEQFKHNVLLDDNFANGWIMVRVRKEHLKKVRENILASVLST